MPLDVDAAALQTVGKRAVSAVELEDRLVVGHGQVREPNRPSLGVAPEVVLVDCLSTILCQRPRRAKQDGHCDECGNGQHPPDAHLQADAGVVVLHRQAVLLQLGVGAGSVEVGARIAGVQGDDPAVVRRRKPVLPQHMIFVDTNVFMYAVGPPGCSSHPPSPPAGPVDTRPPGMRQTASVRESVPTSNPESGKRWNETKVRNGQSLPSARRNGCQCGHRPRSPASVPTTATGPLSPAAVPRSSEVTLNLTRAPPYYLGFGPR